MKLSVDIFIIGGGLSGLLTAWRILDVNPDITIQLHEARSDIAGDHTWSFNETDIAPELRVWLKPFVAYRWDRYDVQFPKRRRTLEVAYCTGNSDTLRACMQPFIDSGRLIVETGRAVMATDIEGPVIDASGYTPRADEFPGWQKFVGRVIRTAVPHGLDHPVIMDATVEQIDGYRFVYLLPFTDREILVEDTYFSDSANLSENEIGARLDDYIAAKGWSDHTVLRHEKGVLPMMMATDRKDASTKIGLGGGFAVAATGFTVPHAVEVADYIARVIAREGVQSVATAIPEFRRQHIRRERYARLLNRMFFRAGTPAQRYKILQRFYGFREGLIRRFYRNGLRRRDKARIVIGKPPVPVGKALYNFSETAFMRRERDKKDSAP